MKEIVLLFLFFFIMWIFPPVFAPAGLSIMGIMIGQSFPSLLLTLVILLAMLSSYLPIWWLAGKVLHKKEPHLTNREQKSFFPRLYDSLKGTIQTGYESEQFRKLNQYLETKNGKILLFCIMIILCSPIIPKIIAVLILRKKVSLRRFILVASIGQTLGSFAIVYGGLIIKWITQSIIQTI